MKRKCPKCKIEKELNLDNFTSNKQRSNGFSHACKICRNKVRGNEYKIYYTTQEKKTNLRIRQRNYSNNTLSGRAITLLKAYKTSDRLKGREFDLNNQWFVSNILEKPCFYCETKLQIGADRIDNTKGHTKDNVLPCCSVCNSMRSDIFTITEMIEIGRKVKELRERREILKISGNKITIIDKK